ncbi:MULTISPECIES: hypothetical protein [unclassified Bradyrhizobium]|uniref:hypothetical protein n=1 Tax=unclassified Bradyrhizobium TaxID=2631580 RepID=UPI0029160094|nr:MULTISPECIES: hypothetical protein [unclassified Bradyrhizobium]
MIKLDIEKLVQWALCDEMPKGRRVNADMSAVVRAMRVGRPGAMAASLRGAPADDEGFGYVPGAPHEDAELIAAAIGELPQEVPMASREDAELLFGEWLPIAGDALDIIRRVTFDQRSLVISHGVLGTRPRWGFRQPAPYQVKTPFRDAAGSLRERPRVVGLDAAGDLVDLVPNRGRRAQREGLYSPECAPRSPLVWGDPAPLAIAESRAEYLAYHHGLCTLAVSLAGRLAVYEPLPPAIRPLPWITGQAPASRVLRGDLGGLDVSADAARLRPQRPIAAAPRRKPSEATRELWRREVAAGRATENRYREF